MSQKFKVGDRAYSIRHGLVKVVKTNFDLVEICVGDSFRANGCTEPFDRNPSLLTLDDAKVKGYITPSSSDARFVFRALDRISISSELTSFFKNGVKDQLGGRNLTSVEEDAIDYIAHDLQFNFKRLLQDFN